MRPIVVEVIAPVLTVYSHCLHCEAVFDQAEVATRTHQAQIEEYPEDVKREYVRLCDWVRGLAGRVGDRVQIRIIDPQSPEGILKAIRHRVRRYPTVIVNGKQTYRGWQEPAVEAALAQLLAEPAPAPAGAQ